MDQKSGSRRIPRRFTRAPTHASAHLGCNLASRRRRKWAPGQVPRPRPMPAPRPCTNQCVAGADSSQTRNSPCALCSPPCAGGNPLPRVRPLICPASLQLSAFAAMGQWAGSEVRAQRAARDQRDSRNPRSPFTPDAGRSADACEDRGSCRVVAGGRRGWRIELCGGWRRSWPLAAIARHVLFVSRHGRAVRCARLCSIVQAGGQAYEPGAPAPQRSVRPRALALICRLPRTLPRTPLQNNTTRIYKSPHTSQPLSFSSSPTLARYHQNSNDLPRRSPCCPRCPRAAARRAPLRVQHAQEGVPGRLRRVRPLPQA